MRSLALLLPASLLFAVGCMGLHGTQTAADASKKVPDVASTPARPPITEDEVTESNTAAAVQALTEELNREERR